MKTKQSGFAVLEGLLILVIVVMVAGIGYYVWHAKQQTDKTLTQASNTNQVTVPQEVVTIKGKYYVSISQWGVKVPVGSNQANRFRYILSSGDADASATIIDTKSYDLEKQLARATLPCASSVQLMRSLDNMFMNADTDKRETLPEGRRSVKLGGYYYFKYPSQGCGYSSSTLDKLDAVSGGIELESDLSNLIQ
jgi:hypothetical protein